MPKTKHTKLDLDETRWLFYRSSDMEAFEDVLGGVSWQRVVSEQGEKRLKALIWAGLRHRDAKITLGQVGEMLDRTRARDDGPSLIEIWQTVLEALQNSGFLPPVVQAGNPTTTDGPTPAPSPGAPSV